MTATPSVDAPLTDLARQHRRVAVLGLAGTGKTSRLLGHYRRLLDEGVPSESVLVLARQPTVDVHADDVVRVTGILREFIYDRYAKEYRLTTPTAHAQYENENVVEATEVGQPTTRRTSTASS